MTRKEEILKQIEALQKELEAIEAAEVAEQQKEPVIEIEVIEKESSKGTKYIHVIHVNGKKFSRSSYKRYNYCLAARHVTIGGNWFIDGFSSEKDGLNSKISYYKNYYKNLGRKDVIETKVIEIK